MDDSLHRHGGSAVLRQELSVTGVVDSINTDLLGNPYVTLRGGVSQFMEPKFKLDSARRYYAAGLQQGLRITLVCRGRGDVAKTICQTSVCRLTSDRKQLLFYGQPPQSVR
jgi:hypothetical protein